MKFYKNPVCVNLFLLGPSSPGTDILDSDNI